MGALDELCGGFAIPEWIDRKCGAKTRRGTACKRRDLGVGGRCRLHGGLSTGPRTRAGKKRSAMNAKRTP